MRTRLRWIAAVASIGASAAILACSTSLDGFSSGAVHSDAGAGTSSGIFCPKTRRCDPATEVCCRRSGDPVTYGCTTREECAPSGVDVVPFRCTSAADCTAQGRAGDTCCLTRDSNANATDVQCVSLDACQTSGKRSMCDPVTTICDRDGEVCTPVASASPLYGMSVCQR